MLEHSGKKKKKKVVITVITYEVTHAPICSLLDLNGQMYCIIPSLLKSTDSEADSVSII